MVALRQLNGSTANIQWFNSQGKTIFMNGPFSRLNGAKNRMKLFSVARNFVTCSSPKCLQMLVAGHTTDSNEMAMSIEEGC